jgi:hypothetical protein
MHTEGDVMHGRIGFRTERMKERKKERKKEKKKERKNERKKEKEPWRMAESVRDKKGAGTRFLNFTNFLIKNPANFLRELPSGIIPLACPLISNIPVSSRAMHQHY